MALKKQTSQNKKKTTRKKTVKKAGGKTAKNNPAKKVTPDKKTKVDFLEVQQNLEQKIASLYEQNRQLKRKIFDLYTIFEISRNFNAVLEFQNLLDTFIFTSLAQVSSSKAAIYLENNHHDDQFVITKHRGSGEFPHGNLRFKAKSKLVDYITKINRPAHVDELLDVTTVISEQKILSRFSPGLAVPLIYQGRMIGLMLISDKISEQPYSNDDIEFLSILGNQITVAIENTRLYEAEKETSQQLLQTQQQLVHSERLAALGDMSAKVAHEVNNPLGIIKNYIQLLKTEDADDGKTGDYLKIVSEEINRIAQIVRELLDFHRPKGYAFRKVQIKDLLDSIIALMERQMAKKQIKIAKTYPETCQEIEASPDGLKQVFLNLILNAYDAMKEKGDLLISVTCNPEELIITIADSGPGIPPEFIPRIFEPFFTTKEEGQGTGLGLSVCYGIIKNHNGSITFKNLDIGGCFEVRLPVKQR